MNNYIERVVDLIEPEANHSTTSPSTRPAPALRAAARSRPQHSGLLRHARKIRQDRQHGALARPAHALLPRQTQAGPVLIVAARIDTIFNWLKSEGLEAQFHPSYTRMVPAHYVVEIQLIGCPDPDPVYTRFFTPTSATLPADLDVIGRTYICALAEEIAQWLQARSRHKNPSASASPEASTAAASSSPPITSCAS